MNAPVTTTPAPSRRIGWLVLLCLFAAFAAGVAHYSELLPDRVATHFGANGRANGWMSREQYRAFTIAFGIGTPLFVIGTFALLPRLNGWGLNIPNKAYWLAPERRDETFAYVSRLGFWIAALMVLFHSGLFWMTIIANARKPAVLPMVPFLVTVGAFLAAIGVWSIFLFVRFRLPKT